MIIAATKDEIKKWIKVNNNFDPKNLLPAENDAKYILYRFIGKPQYDAIETAYAANTLSPVQLELHQFIQNAMVNLSYLYYIPEGQLEVSDAGIHINSSKDRKTGFNWQIIDLQKGAKRRAFKAIEQMLQYLWKTPPATFPLWEADEASKEYKKFLINDSLTFNKSYSINNDFSLFLSIRDIIEEITNDYIIPTLGEALYDELHTQFISNTLSIFNKKLLAKVQKPLAVLSMNRALVRKSARLDEFGLQEDFQSMVLLINASNPARDSLLSAQLRESERIGEQTIHALRRHLIDKAVSYPLYTPPTPTDLKINDQQKGFYAVL